ncbi:MAG TPA: UDPGP type 1 family protein [Planctomycetota bacterium]|nr:UDPGP type 1 family protein [Planctomycetota bacterium]
MIKVRDEKDQANIAKVYRAGQEHIFRYWDELAPDDRRALLDQVDRLDFQLLARLAQRIDEKPPLHKLEPPPGVVRLADAREAEERWRALGEGALEKGKVGALLVAGGQGTRLGFPGPKGCFPVGPITGKTLFQYFAEAIAALGRRYRTTVPWYVMTSEGNHEAVTGFFKEHNTFGLGRSDVFFFRQRELAALDPHGKLLLAGKGEIATSPNGHGGVVPALRESGALEDMARRGVEWVHYWQVDNPLVKVADPAFLGCMIEREAEAGAKVASKRDPGEKVGVWGLVDGKLGVIEYSELPKEDAERRDAEGRLLYDAGNLAIHGFSRAFLERLAGDGLSLPYHKAHKKVPYVNRKGEKVEPTEPNGVKFEMFVFDAIAEARNVVIYEIDRAEEFAPVKNAEGEDSPATCRRALVERDARRLEAAGAKVKRDAAGAVPFPIEISPAAALDAEDLKRHVEPGQEIAGDFKL